MIRIKSPFSLLLFYIVLEDLAKASKLEKSSFCDGDESSLVGLRRVS
jgi:hypothetical protein